MASFKECIVKKSMPVSLKMSCVLVGKRLGCGGGGGGGLPNFYGKVDMTNKICSHEQKVCHRPELQIRESIEDHSKIIFLICQ